MRKQVNLPLDTKLWKKLRKIAIDKECSTSDLIEECIKKL